MAACRRACSTECLGVCCHSKWLMRLRFMDTVIACQACFSFVRVSTSFVRLSTFVALFEQSWGNTRIRTTTSSRGWWGALTTLVLARCITVFIQWLRCVCSFYVLRGLRVFSVNKILRLCHFHSDLIGGMNLLIRVWCGLLPWYVAFRDVDFQNYVYVCCVRPVGCRKIWSLVS